MRMPMHSIHLGEFVAGKFTLPQTPVTTSGPGFSGLSEFVAGKFAVPQNPILDAQTGMSGCGCGGGCGGGMGDLSTDLSNTWTALQGQTILSMPAGYVVSALFIAAIALPMWMAGRKR